MLDFIVFVVFIFLVLIMFKKYCIPVLKEEIKQAEIRTNKLNLKVEVLNLEKEKIELEIKKLKG